LRKERSEGEVKVVIFVWKWLSVEKGLKGKYEHWYRKNLTPKDYFWDQNLFKTGIERI
jgi:hypothetical protein